MLYKSTSTGRVKLTKQEEEEILAMWDANNSLAAKKAGLKNKVRLKRHALEVAGLIFNNKKIDTSEKGQARLASLMSYLSSNPIKTVDFPYADGTFQNLSSIELADVNVAVGAFVIDLLNKEYAHVMAIDVLTTIEQVNTYNIDTGW